MPGLHLDGKVPAEAVASISKHVASILSRGNDPRLKTAIMQPANTGDHVVRARVQVLMEAAYKQQRELIEKETGEQQERAGMLHRAVTGPRALKGNSAEAYDKFYKLVLEAVRAALESVFPVSAVARFLTLTEEERLAQLSELARITTGICLYNRSLGQGGTALPAAAASYLPQAQRLLRDLNRCRTEVTEQMAKLHAMVAKLPPPPADGDGPAAAAVTSAATAGGEEELRRALLHAEVLNRGQALQLYESLHAYIPGHSGTFHGASPWATIIERIVDGAIHVTHGSLAPSLHHTITILRSPSHPLGNTVNTSGDAPDDASDGLYTLHNCVCLLDAVGADLQEGLEAAQLLDAELEHTLVQVHESVGQSAAVSKDTVYPLFDRLGALHTGLHQELRMLVVRQRLYDELSELSVLPAKSLLLPAQAPPRKPGVSTSTQTSSSSNAAAVDALSEQLNETTLAGLDALQGGTEGGSSGELEYIRPTSHTQLQPGLALAGFCAGTLARRPTGRYPLLRRSNPRLGYLAYQDKVYGFATNADMQAFLADPAGCLAAVDAAVRKEPLLARPLGLPPPRPSADVHAVLQAMSGTLKVDFGCQTPVHFVERYIDKDYEWNVWALRRRALALANLRGKATHSTQTAESHFKRENETQVWRPREATVQTKVAKGQSMPPCVNGGMANENEQGATMGLEVPRFLTGDGHERASTVASFLFTFACAFTASRAIATTWGVRPRSHHRRTRPRIRRTHRRPLVSTDCLPPTGPETAATSGTGILKIRAAFPNANESWSYVCGDPWAGWDANAANAACRQAGYPSGGDPLRIWRSGSETTLSECDVTGAPEQTIQYWQLGVSGEDAAGACEMLAAVHCRTGVASSAQVLLRAASSPSPSGANVTGNYTGTAIRLEASVGNGEYGAVCLDDGFDDPAALVACRSLGFSTGVVYPNGAPKGTVGSAARGVDVQGSYLATVSSVRCGGAEANMTSCASWRTNVLAAAIPCRAAAWVLCNK
ncbi:hypothetical protein VOLCADRAFT_105292 [Volvox carteri f. nagariensis]|uniref:Cilia- and flagella-associated protein 206 n=1 Tax=Volvox carteri f. nagariensis TaxID=3068 RepID=D8TZU5_VOLCA|nr:uncharacterized protein VOLCADRAFT_105292 [Volvox carteri f. nagariensis]EFJ47078.1 hypothetical protein VOLCADRAFT_105292 [Volvox carteri f. nagariensis]|eukprot:XP_002951973.1 hypothetical protein VOLCADRAFT_105292 [Volvox carteri f. nagariensis]